MPDVDGIELMGQLPELADLPVIFISGYGRDETVAKALESGAADYIIRPFSPTELVAQVRAALRRSEEPEPFAVGEIAIDYGQRRVTIGRKAVELTTTEYELLRVLSLNAGRVVTFETLLRRVSPSGRAPARPWCASLSATPAASSATARPAPPISSTTAAPATAWRSGRTGDAKRPATRGARRIQRCACYRTASPSGPNSPRRRVTGTMAPCHTRNHIPSRRAALPERPASTGPIASSGKSERPLYLSQ